MPRMVTAERKTKEIRREEILDAALIEFAARGLHGASTEDIAKRAGISQPYVFRLFGTKKELFRAVVARCFRETLEMFQRSAEGLRGKEALDAIGNAYISPSTFRRFRAAPRGQMQAYAALRRPGAPRDGPARLRRPRRLRRAGLRGARRRRRSRGSSRPGCSTEDVFASMGQIGEEADPWALRLLEACEKA